MHLVSAVVCLVSCAAPDRCEVYRMPGTFFESNAIKEYIKNYQP